MIPKNIFQSHKSIDYVLDDMNLKKATQTWRKDKSFHYYFYDNKRCESFMREKFSGKIYETYQKMPIPVMKADLWRYCIIYHYGGIYADTDVIIKNTPSFYIKNNADMCIACEYDGVPTFAQFFFAAKQNSPILKEIINTVVSNFEKYELNQFNYKLTHNTDTIVQHLTGPAAFTNGIESYLRRNNLKTHKTIPEYQGYDTNYLCVFKNDHFWNNMFHLCMGRFSGWRQDAINKKL
jgi:mannosyltransferase OCH1-like enzyme